MKKYSEITLTDEEKKILEWLKDQEYTYIGRSNCGFIEVFDIENDVRVNLMPMRRPFEFIGVGDRYEIKKLLNPPHEPKTVWKLEDGDEYWSVSAAGIVYKETWNNGCPDIDCRSQGNAFLTREEAEFEAKRREVVTKVRKYSRPFTPSRLQNWFPYYDHVNDKIKMDYTDYKHEHCDYFVSESNIQKAIDEVGEDDFKKYYLGVAEND